VDGETAERMDELVAVGPTLAETSVTGGQQGGALLGLPIPNGGTELDEEPVHGAVERVPRLPGYPLQLATAGQGEPARRTEPGTDLGQDPGDQKGDERQGRLEPGEASPPASPVRRAEREGNLCGGQTRDQARLRVGQGTGSL
jgi:hypothetical protein